MKMNGIGVIRPPLLQVLNGGAAMHTPSGMGGQGVVQPVSPGTDQADSPIAPPPAGASLIAPPRAAGLRLLATSLPEEAKPEERAPEEVAEQPPEYTFVDEEAGMSFELRSLRRRLTNFLGNEIEFQRYVRAPFTDPDEVRRHIQEHLHYMADVHGRDYDQYIKQLRATRPADDEVAARRVDEECADVERRKSKLCEDILRGSELGAASTSSHTLRVVARIWHETNKNAYWIKTYEIKRTQIVPLRSDMLFWTLDELTHLSTELFEADYR